MHNHPGGDDPQRSTDPVPYVPSVDGAELAVVLRTVQWTLDDLAHDLPAGRATPQRLWELAALLEQLAVMLRARSGIVPGDSGEE